MTSPTPHPPILIEISSPAGTQRWHYATELASQLGLMLDMDAWMSDHQDVIAVAGSLYTPETLAAYIAAERPLIVVVDTDQFTEGAVRQYWIEREPYSGKPPGAIAFNPGIATIMGIVMANDAASQAWFRTLAAERLE